MSYLRVMTFNVQLLPTVPFVASPGNEAKPRAQLIGRALALLPATELPDVIAFNEVFSEDGRDELLIHLSPLYPYIIAKLDDCALGQDSGLLLASHYPFLPLPTSLNPIQNEQVLFFSFVDTAAWTADALACKGVGIVQIDCPLGIVTIAFTHTQAYYNHAAEHSDVRRKQMGSIAQTLTRLLGAPPSSDWSRLLLIGDLNIRGDIDIDTVDSEWHELFIKNSGLLSDHLCDGWRTYMRPPMQTSELDAGYTNNNLEPGENGQLPAGLLARLDYQCFLRLPKGDLVPQQMRTRFRALSDHWSLEADIHHFVPHCTPSDAIQWATVPETSRGQRIVDLAFEFEGTYQWIYVNEHGTYTIFRSVPLEVTYFAVKNLSDSWQPYDRVDGWAMGVDKFDVWIDESQLEPEGEQIDLPGPFFIRVRGGAAMPDYRGTCRIGIYRHTGETKASAIVLRSWGALKDPVLPYNQPNGALDQCWFRADLPEAFSRASYESNFVIVNSTGNLAIGTLIDQHEQPLYYEESEMEEFSLHHTTNGSETIFVVLERTSTLDTAFRVGWQAGLTYLRSVANLRPMVLRCIDETGIDKLGADEINLKLYADDVMPHFFEVNWTDADTDEILKLEGSVPEIAFVNTIDVVVEESDWTASGSSATRIGALTASDPTLKSIEQAFSVQSGTYRFECTLTRSAQ